VNALSRYNAEPTSQHWHHLKRLLRYLRGTTGAGMTYRGTGSMREQPVTMCYCDADYGFDVGDRKSVSGYAVMMCGGAINWSSRKQYNIAQSTVEAEFNAMTEAVKDVLWWRVFLAEIGHDMGEPTIVFCDNKGAVDLTANPAHHDKTKHFAIRQAFVRHHVVDRDIEVDHIATERNVADILTKALAKIKHVAGVALLGMTLP
jgi:hypothetical protein